MLNSPAWLTATENEIATEERTRRLEGEARWRERWAADRRQLVESVNALLAPDPPARLDAVETEWRPGARDDGSDGYRHVYIEIDGLQFRPDRLGRVWLGYVTTCPKCAGEAVYPIHSRKALVEARRQAASNSPPPSDRHTCRQTIHPTRPLVVTEAPPPTEAPGLAARALRARLATLADALQTAAALCGALLDDLPE